jgi:uncharacterized protein (DUF427 family)
MFDHVTLRVPDLAAASSAFAAVLDQLEIGQTASMSSFSVWGNFALTQTDRVASPAIRSSEPSDPRVRRCCVIDVAPSSSSASAEAVPHPLKERDMLKEVKIPGPDHPITIEPTTDRVVVRVREHVIAESETALTLSEAGYAPVQYLPIGDVDATLIQPSDTRTYCPYKGEATYYSIVLPAATIKDAIWTYVSPYDAVSEIAGHLAVYDGKEGITVKRGQ